MIRPVKKDMLLTAFIGSAVLMIALTLLMIVVRSPYTHANLNTGFDASYTRTEQLVVGAPIPFGDAALVVTPASDPVERGRQLFIINSCATCHGLTGSGGIVGPSILGTKPEKLRSTTRVGPKGMPAYAPGTLSDDDLASIAAFLQAMDK